MMGDPLKKAQKRYVAPIDEAELACRIYEAEAQAKRPPGMDAIPALATLDEATVAQVRRAAKAAMTYWSECIAAANSVS